MKKTSTSFLVCGLASGVSQATRLATNIVAFQSVVTRPVALSQATRLHVTSKRRRKLCLWLGQWRKPGDQTYNEYRRDDEHYEECVSPRCPNEKLIFLLDRIENSDRMADLSTMSSQKLARISGLYIFGYLSRIASRGNLERSLQWLFAIGAKLGGTRPCDGYLFCEWEYLRQFMVNRM